MRVRILDLASGKLQNAIIRSASVGELPSIQEGWNFNFNKLAKAANTKAYVLVKEDTQDVLEGCMLFERKNKEIAYMSYLETAPHNKGNQKRYDYVAGCLIAFAYAQSLVEVKEPYNGQLFFDVLEQNPKNQIKLMALYSVKYGAVKYTNTTMLIIDEAGDNLIREYLERK
jgi:hypothetical protein